MSNLVDPGLYVGNVMDMRTRPARGDILHHRKDSAVRVHVLGVTGKLVWLYTVRV